MKCRIDKTCGEAAYMQIYKQLRGDIVSGLHPEGERLPSKRFLAAELGVSVITVQHAYELLTDDGYIRARERSGYYVCFGGAPLKRERTYEGSAESFHGDFPFSVLARTMRKVLADKGERILIKPENSGCPELKEAIADYLARSRGISVLPERIIIGSGAEYLYGLAVQLLGRERLYALEEPCYSKIKRVYEANGARCTGLKLEEDGISAQELLDCKASVLHVTPYHSYPSGVTASASKRHEYAAWARERDGYIIEDDYDSEFAVATKQVETIFSLAPERVIYVNTFSKTLAPALRTGYMLLPEPLLKEYGDRLNFYSCTVPTYEQYVLAEFINNGELERCINRRRRKLRQN